MALTKRIRSNTPALAVATLALVAAFSGGATAATMINGSRLVNNTVTSAKITNGTVQKADVKPLAWKPITLANGWVYYGDGGFGTQPQYTKDVNGFVHLRGVLSGSSKTSDIIGSLPSGFRPPAGAWVPVGHSNGSYNPSTANVFIQSNGNMTWLPGSGTNPVFVSLEGVTFYAG